MNSRFDALFYIFILLTIIPMLVMFDGMFEAATDYCLINDSGMPNIIPILDCFIPQGYFLIVYSLSLSYVIWKYITPSKNFLIMGFIWLNCMIGAVSLLAFTIFWTEPHLLLDGERPWTISRYIGNSAMVIISLIAAIYMRKYQRDDI